MKLGIGNCLTVVAVIGLSLPLSAADLVTAPTIQRAITDVSLTKTGDLLGAVVEKDGRPLAGQTVQVLSKNKLIAVAKTDSAGRYRIKGLRSGVHQINTRQAQNVCRIWQHSAAPPTAKKGVVTAQSETVLRGQNDGYIELGGANMLGLALFGGATAATLSSTLANDDPISASLGSNGNNDSSASP